MFSFFLSSGFFLGWSLGANDASNVFGTAVGSKMIRFKTAAIYCSLFVILGAVISGAGASHTLGKLGAVNALAGAFLVAFSAALSVYLMTLAKFPVSTSQAIVGSIIGWNLFSGSVTDINALTKIVSTWIFCPALSACFAICLYKATTIFVSRFKIRMFRLDLITRYSLLSAGIFGSYALGANNIANVMGVFVPVAPFSHITLLGVTFSPAQQLFFLGGVAIAVGVFTYSKRVMMTVGTGIFTLTPVAASVVVWSHSAVLFIFSSQALEAWLQSYNLPTIPLVPVSSSQAIVGAVIGIGLLKGGRGIRWRTVAGITSSWVTTPIIAALACFISLFFMQNVFQQKTYTPVEYNITQSAMQRLIDSELPYAPFEPLMWETFPNGMAFSKAIHSAAELNNEQARSILAIAELFEVEISPDLIQTLMKGPFTKEQINILSQLEGRTFQHKWEIKSALAEESEMFRYRPADKQWNSHLDDFFYQLINRIQT
ncbi:MAG: inorganic phosphate transporter [Desulfofustis sp.]|nr:inorganic phosphate transporter [Desulfofustis sp.]